MLLAVSYDFLGLGPTNGVSLGDMMNKASCGAPCTLAYVVVVHTARAR